MAYAEAPQNAGSASEFSKTSIGSWRVRIIDGQGNLLGWGYGKSGEPRTGADNSNSQYALLGLWAGKLSGANIDDKVWQQIREFYVRTQNSDDGSWVYTTRGGPGSLTMTTAGLCGLLIAGMEINSGREVLRPDGTAENCGNYDENPAISKALCWIGPHMRFDQPVATYYNLYGIERAGRLSGLRFFGNHDWYREGCNFSSHSKVRTAPGRDSQPARPLARHQHQLRLAVSVEGPHAHSHQQGRAHRAFPQRESDTDWNNDRNDLRHLTQFASKNLFNSLPLAWQTFDMLRAGAAQPAAASFPSTCSTGKRPNWRSAQSTGEPLAWRRGPETNRQRHQATWKTRSSRPCSTSSRTCCSRRSCTSTATSRRLDRFRPIERELLRRYVDNGGFIIVEACCGKPEFDEGFKALAQSFGRPTRSTDLGTRPSRLDQQIHRQPGRSVSSSWASKWAARRC